LENITLFTGDKSRLLIDDLTVEIRRGSRWLVTGPDDAPKLALFRATAGVWDCGAGKILRPGLEDILFLPERPYLPPGPLRDALVRTVKEAEAKDPAIHAVLHRLGLHQVVERVGGLDTEKDWDDVFSIGEQHLLSIARIFLAHPSFVFLDRPGSSLSKPQISTILEMLSEHGIGAVVLAKDGESSLHYDACLEIKADGRWEIIREPGSDEPGGHGDLRDLSC
jgi:putative ATP-binding cassette transporter